MEIAFKRTPAHGWYENAQANVCSDQLRKEVALPKGEPKFYAVFTKEKIVDSFCIQAPHRRLACGLISGLAGLRSSVTLTTRVQLILAKAYARDFRYVRIEY